jgi:hypothetical protein
VELQSAEGTGVRILLTLPLVVPFSDDGQSSHCGFL